MYSQNHKHLGTETINHGGDNNFQWQSDQAWFGNSNNITVFSVQNAVHEEVHLQIATRT